MPTTAQTSTCSGMQAKPSYEVGLLPSSPCTKERSLTNFREASDHLRHAQAQLSTSNTPTHCDIWRNAKTNFDQWAEYQVCIHKSYSELQYHKFGNKSGKLLAKLYKVAHVPIHITSLKDTQGNSFSSPTDISSIPEQDYNALYDPDTFRPERSGFLKEGSTSSYRSYSLCPTQLPDHQAGNPHNNFLLCQWEILDPDGYTPEFFKLMAHTLVPTLASVYQTMLQGGNYLPSTYQAHIRLIAKKGKDPSDPFSYRPISLLT